MSVTVSVKFEGVKATKFFGRLPIHIKKALNNAIMKSAFLVERESKRVAPVDTGRLRSSIFTIIEPLKATVQPRVNYAIFVHEGTFRMRSRPFMRWGAEKARNEIQRIFNNEIKRIL